MDTIAFWDRQERIGRWNWTVPADHARTVNRMGQGKWELAKDNHKGGYCVLTRVRGVLRPILRNAKLADIKRRLDEKRDFVYNWAREKAKTDKARQEGVKREMAVVHEDFHRAAKDKLMRSKELRQQYLKPRTPKTDGTGPNRGGKYYGPDFKREN